MTRATPPSLLLPHPPGAPVLPYQALGPAHRSLSGTLLQGQCGDASCSLPSLGQPPGEMHGEDLGPFSLVGDEHRNPKLLPTLPSVPAHHTEDTNYSSTYPMPIISIPFERVGMDLMGPLSSLPRVRNTSLSSWAIPPDILAVPLQKATSKNIAREIILLFSHVGFPKDLLTDQGMPFISKLMTEVYQLLQVKQVCTLDYHPQTMKRFNQTLKRMLQRVLDKDGRN